MPSFERKVLVLDSRYQPVKVVSLEVGFVLLYTDRATSVTDSERTLRSVNSTYKVPWVIALNSCSPRTRRSLSPRFSRQNVYLRDGYSCQYCGWMGPLSHLTLDHLLPSAKGGKTSWENVVTACRPCNHRKGARTIEELGVRPRNMPFRPTFSSTAIFALRFGLTRKNAPEVWRPYIDFSVTDKLLAIYEQQPLLQLSAAS